MLVLGRRNEGRDCHSKRSRSRANKLPGVGCKPQKTVCPLSFANEVASLVVGQRRLNWNSPINMIERKYHLAHFFRFFAIGTGLLFEPFHAEEDAECYVETRLEGDRQVRTDVVVIKDAVANDISKHEQAH